MGSGELEPAVRALEAHRVEYADLVDSWKALDGKAQGTVAIAGIFLAGAFGFARTIGQGLGVGEKLVFVATLAALWAAVALSAAALYIRQVRFPPSAKTIEEELRKVEASTGGERAEEQKLVIYDVAESYGHATDAIRDAIARKGVRVASSQIALGCGAILTTVLAAWRVWTA